MSPSDIFHFVHAAKDIVNANFHENCGEPSSKTKNLLFFDDFLGF